MSGPATPTIIPTPWGTNALPGDINVVPLNPPSNPAGACYANGFPTIDRQPIGSGGAAPLMQDFNGAYFDITSNIAWLQAGGLYQYNASIATAIGGYNAGALLLMANLSGLWISTANGNTNNPDTSNPSTNNWQPAIANGQGSIAVTTGTVTLTSVQAANAQIFLAGTLSGNVTIVLPTWTQNWFFFDDTVHGTSNYTITVKTPSGTGVVLPYRGGYVSGDGTNINYASVVRGPFTAIVGDGVNQTSPFTCYYSINSSIVTITIPTYSAIASGSTVLFLTGLPAQLVPLGAPLQQCALAIAENNSSFATGIAFAQPYYPSSVPTIGFGLNGGLTGWTASGTKLARGTFTYDIYAGI